MAILVFNIPLTIFIVYCLWKGAKLLKSRKLVRGPLSLSLALVFLIFNYFSMYQAIDIISTMVAGGSRKVSIFYQYLTLPIIFFFTGYLCARNNENVVRENAVMVIFLGYMPVFLISFLIGYRIEDSSYTWYLCLSYPPMILIGAYVYYKNADNLGVIRTSQRVVSSSK